MKDSQFFETTSPNDIQPLYADDGGEGGLPVVFLHGLAGRGDRGNRPLAAPGPAGAV